MGPSLHIVQHIAQSLSKQMSDYKRLDNTKKKKKLETLEMHNINHGGSAMVATQIQEQ